MNEFLIDKYFINLFSNLISDNLTIIAKIITFFGSEICFAIICIIFLILNKNKIKSIILATNLLLIVIIVHFTKIIVHRPRPNYNSLTYEGSYSFPSGHACISMAFYGLLIYFLCKSNISKSLKIIISVLISLLILFIGLSRVYLGVHYITDVIAGFILGIIYLIVFIKVIKNKL